MTVTTRDGYELTVYETMYMDYGLSIVDPNGVEVFNSPHALSNESYGSKPDPDRFDDWEDAERASLEGDESAFVPWTSTDWDERIEAEANELIEAYVGFDQN